MNRELIQTLLNEREYGKAFELLKPHLNFENDDEESVYVLKQLSIVCYHNEEKELGYKVCCRLIDLNQTLGFNNLFWYMKPIKSKHVLNFNIKPELNKDDYNVSSTSIISYKDGYLCIVRLVSYTINEKGFYMFRGKRWCNTENVVILFDKNMNEIDQVKIECPDVFKTDDFIRGMEDIRAICIDDVIHISFSAKSDGKIVIYKAELDENFQVKNYRKGITNNMCEKNWTPILIDNKVKYIYKYNDFSIYDFDDDSVSIYYQKTKINTNFRGSTPCIPYKDGFLSICHFIGIVNGRRAYYHAFIYHDNNYVPVKSSKPFTFENSIIEYTLGMTWKNDELLIPFSVNDASCKMISVTKDEIEKWFD